MPREPARQPHRYRYLTPQLVALYKFLVIQQLNLTLTCLSLLLVNLAAGTALYLSTPRAEFLAGRFVYANWDMEAVEALKEIIVRDDLLKTKVSLGKQLKGATMMR